MKERRRGVRSGKEDVIERKISERREFGEAVSDWSVTREGPIRLLREH